MAVHPWDPRPGFLIFDSTAVPESPRRDPSGPQSPFASVTQQAVVDPWVTQRQAAPSPFASVRRQTAVEAWAQTSVPPSVADSRGDGAESFSSLGFNVSQYDGPVLWSQGGSLDGDETSSVFTTVDRPHSLDGDETASVTSSVFTTVDRTHSLDGDETSSVFTTVGRSPSPSPSESGQTAWEFPLWDSDAGSARVSETGSEAERPVFDGPVFRPTRWASRWARRAQAPVQPLAPVAELPTPVAKWNFEEPPEMIIDLM